MGHDIKTLELAKIYETQGYFRTAHKIYVFLDEEKTSSEIRAGLIRCEKRINVDQAVDNHASEDNQLPVDDQILDTQLVDVSTGVSVEKKISALLEKWLMLMVLQRRLNTYKKIQARLI